MKLSALTLLLLCVTTLSFGQSKFSIKGAVTDTMATYKMVNTTITVLNQKDSTLVKYTRANAAGTFFMDNLRPGKFIILITYPGYADYADEFTLDAGSPAKDFGSIDMILKSTLLEGVIIKGKAAAIKIKGDTTEYNADSYIIQPNSKVEDLLRQLPGIQVDRNGKITAQGQTVTKVLLDGEEFFSDDPLLVTRNIRGDMVDKVQLYDKKSDEAMFTGIDDGERTKTINIKTKADKKTGYFGNVEAGIGNDKLYEAQGTYNSFSDARRFAVFAGSANTNRTSIGIGNPEGIEIVESGGSVQGITRINNGGVHFEDKFNDDKDRLNADYTIGNSHTDGNSNTQAQNNLPDRVLFSNTDQSSSAFAFKHSLRSSYNMTVNPKTFLNISLNGTLGNGNSDDDYQASNMENHTLLNTSKRNVNTETDTKLVNIGLNISRNLKKPGRTLRFSINQSINNNESNGFLNSINTFYNRDGQIDSTKNIDQYKVNRSNSEKFTTNLIFTEKLGRQFSVAINYGINISNNSLNRDSYNKSASGHYDLKDAEFSNNYKLNQFSHLGGINFNFSKGKALLNAGTKIDAVDFRQYDLQTNKRYTRNFINWAPNLSYNYKFGQTQDNLMVRYSGNTIQPRIEQIQPIRVNTDPLNIIIGNATLKPAYSSAFAINYSGFRLMSEQMFGISANYSFTANQIINNAVTDNTGKTVSQVVNLNNKTPSNFSISSLFSRKLNNTPFNLSAGLSFNGSKSYSYINGTLNAANSYMYAPSIGSNYSKANIRFNLSGGPTYNTISSSLQNNSSSGWGIMGSGDLNVSLPGKIVFNTNANYQYTGKTKVFREDFSRLILDAAISKKFFSQQNLSINIKGNDLMNQNKGFSRYENNNLITQNNFTVMKRYILCTISWDFNKMGSSSPKN